MRFNCHDCYQRFKWDDDLQCHSKGEHVENSDELYECKICEAVFSGEEILKKHHDTSHTTHLDFQCQLCEFFFQMKIAC